MLRRLLIAKQTHDVKVAAKEKQASDAITIAKQKRDAGAT